MGPGLFVGTLRHRRFGPVPHAFTHRLFMALLDVDAIPDLMRVSRVTGYNTWNWATFDDRDHFGDPRRRLRERIEAEAVRAGVTVPDGPIYLLTHLRYLGHCFNPVSIFYMFDRTGALARVLAEVHNTFGGTHLHWLEPQAGSATFRATAAKSLYVSPFLAPDLEYRFALTTPGEALSVHVAARRGGARQLDATLSLVRRPWTAHELRLQLLRHPAMTAGVVAAIHWQALRIWWKGVPVVPRLTPDGVGERAAWDAAQRQRGASTVREC